MPSISSLSFGQLFVGAGQVESDLRTFDHRNLPGTCGGIVGIFRDLGIRRRRGRQPQIDHRERNHPQLDRVGPSVAQIDLEVERIDQLGQLSLELGLVVGRIGVLHPGQVDRRLQSPGNGGQVDASAFGQFARGAHFEPQRPPVGGFDHVVAPGAHAHRLAVDQDLVDRRLGRIMGRAEQEPVQEGGNVPGVRGHDAVPAGPRWP